MMEIGHVAYGGASAFLDAFAQHKNTAGNGVVMSVNWASWSEVGGALKLAKERAKAMGISSPTKIEGGILSVDGIEAFNRIMESDPAIYIPQVVVYPHDLIKQITLSKTVNSQKSIAKIETSKEGFQRPKLESEYAPPRNDIEQILVNIWSKFFGFEQVGIRDDFFELGGDSLKAIVITSLIEKNLDAKVSIATLFSKTTIEEIARYIEESAIKSKFSPISPIEKKEYYKISSAQKRLYILQQMEPASTAFNESHFVALEGKLKIEKFKSIFKTLIKRHESFRTSFEMLNDEPVQKVSRDTSFNVEYFEVEMEQNNSDCLPPSCELINIPAVARIVNNFPQPFDLARSPLLRAGFIKLSKNLHILMMDFHHIIWDGVSESILIKDIVHLYKEEGLLPLRLGYKDFSQWQHQLVNSGKIKKQEAYWINRFEGNIPLLKIPTDFPRKAEQSYEGEDLSITIDGLLTGEINVLNSKYGTTLYITLLAVFSILLSKYTAQSDIIIGSTIAGRSHADLDNVVGVFVNFLLMRIFLGPEKTFEEFLLEVKAITLDAFENQDYQFDDLVERLKSRLERDTDKNPLYNVIFALSNIENSKIRLSELNLESLPREKTTAKTELRLRAVETAEGISLKFTYVAALFKKATIEEMATHYIEIINQVVKNNEIKLRDINISDQMAVLVPLALRRDESEFNF
jgi:acyl carrier protein